jgi:F-type H+-transporting ATPase subunit b
MEIHWYQILFQLINFGILVFVLKKFLYQPIINIINQRNKKIEDSIRAAESNLKEKAKIEEIKKQAIAEAEKEAVRIVENSKKQAGEEAKKIITAGREEAETEVKKKLELLTEKLNEQEQKITGHLTDLVVSTVSRVLKSSLSEADQHKIIDQQIKHLHKLK